MSEASSSFRADLLSAVDCPVCVTGQDYWIYGAGGFGRSLARELGRLNQNVRGFVDRKGRAVERIDGLPCIHPDDLEAKATRGTRYLHGLMNWETPSDMVLDWAANREFSRLMFPAELYGLPGFALDAYWLTDPSHTLENMDELEWLHNALDDEDSRRLLLQLLRFRLTSDPRLHPLVDSAAYTPAFLPIFDDPITFIDAGAFTGDTLDAVLAAGVRIAEWIAIEPDSENLVALRRTARRNRGCLAGFTLIGAGLGEQTGSVQFDASRGAASRVLTGGARNWAAGEVVDVPVVRLDDVVHRSGNLYVKMDIEGSELGALTGMPDLLRQRPTLAISLYHRPSDLWTIPKLVSQLYERPRMRLRQHGHQGFDTVLYVTPA